MNEYINIQAMKLDIIELLKDVRDNINFEHEEFVDDKLNDDYLNEYAEEYVAITNNSMRIYLHAKDKSIMSNFRNLDYDYCKHITGESNYNKDLMNDLIMRLDNGDESEQTKLDRDYLNEWCRETFGIDGIRTHFIDDALELQCEYEREGALVY